ncbi:MAG TPA: SufD family Fe-S cluster assembly protein [Candidatus Azoamicus sp.]
MFFIRKHASLEKKGGYSLKNISKCSIICKINHYENESKSKTIIKTTNKNSELQFKGNIEVGMNVENVEANLKCNGIMLSKKGNIEFIPELSINNNNVICSHEATIGHIDKNIIKYMQSRGIKEKKCITELMKIFFYEISNNNKILSKIINKN